MTNQLPAYLQNKTSRGLAQTLVANLGAGSPPFLSIQGNRFTLIDAVGEEIAVPTYDPKTGPYIDVCIIDALEHTSKIYYDKPFDPAASQYEPPACWSDNGIGPSRNAAKPQARTCAECPQGAWGSKVSAVSGKGVKACNDVQKVAFIYQGFEMPFLLRLPPNSRTNFRNYVNKFVGQQMDIEDVMTRITFEQGGIGTLKFDAIGWLDEQTTVPLRNKLIAAKATDNMIGRTDLPRLEALPAPATIQVAGGPVTPLAAAGELVQGQVYHAPHVTASAQGVAPFAPPAAQPSAGASGAPQGATAQNAVPSPQPEPQRRRRRTQAQIAADNAAQSAGTQPVAVPQFAPTQQPAPFLPPQQAPAAQAPAPNGGFGIAQGAAPNPELSKTLDSLFGKQG